MSGIHIRHFGIFVLLVACSTNLEGWRPFKLTIKSATAEVFSTLTTINVSLSSSGAISIWIHILQDIPHPFLHAELYVDSGKGGFDFEIVNRTVNLCEFFRNQQSEPLLQIFYKILLENGPWPTACPIRKTQFSIENWIIDPDKFPPYLPERKGFTSLRFQSKENHVMKDINIMTIVFEVENTGIDRLKRIKKRKN